MKLNAAIQNLFKGGDEPAEAILADLLLAAQRDEEFRRRVMALLSVPDIPRESLVDSALHEMSLRGEPANVRRAFGLLVSPQGAALAREVLSDQ
jgi:hypothetical protein